LRSASLFTSDSGSTDPSALDRSAAALRVLQTRATRDSSGTLDITQATLSTHLGLGKRTLRVGLASLEQGASSAKALVKHATLDGGSLHVALKEFALLRCQVLRRFTKHGHGKRGDVAEVKASEHTATCSGCATNSSGRSRTENRSSRTGGSATKQSTEQSTSATGASSASSTKAAQTTKGSADHRVNPRRGSSKATKGCAR
jgi:hypothetical protein